MTDYSKLGPEIPAGGERTHKARRIVLKEADIDEGIIDVVLWLNGMDGVNTRHSCEGSDISPPNVVLSCDDEINLAHILSMTRDWGVDVVVDWDIPSFPFRYCMRFDSCETLGEFSEMLRDTRLDGE